MANHYGRWLALGAAAVLAGCSGSSGTTGSSPVGRTPTLLRAEYGRLVDVYAFRRVDDARADRRLTENRVPVRIERDVVVSAAIESQDLIDAIGEANPNANYRFLPFDVRVGHEELLILWDDRAPGESERFSAALNAAKQGLVEVPAAFRDQNLTVRPIPVVPRNAAIRLVFDGPLGVDEAFFAANPAAIQLLRFRDDPNVVAPQRAFEPADYRVIVKNERLVIDTTLIGAESRGRISTGLEPSGDNRTANYRIAIPTDGAVSRAFKVAPDEVSELNGVDSRGAASVIRDFRSGNARDGKVGALADVESPTIVAELDMGIIDIDEQNRVLTLMKRFHQVALRGRVPFVDGARNPDTRLPGGPTEVPAVSENGLPLPLPSGDFIMQTLVSPAGETVLMKAEIVENLEVGSIKGDARFAAPGLTAAGTDDGDLPVVRVRVASLTTTDSVGNVVAFQSSTNPAGADCLARVRYYEHIPYSGAVNKSGVVSDARRRAEFMIFDPNPPRLDPVTGQPLNVTYFRTHVSPLAGIGIRFSEPMDVANVSSLDNMFLTTEDITVKRFGLALSTPKLASLTMLASRVVDQEGDGTLLRVTPPMGHYHEANAASPESYWFHMDLGANGVRDLAGNVVDIFDKRVPGTIDVPAASGGVISEVEVPLRSFSVEYVLDAKAQSNRVASRVFRFESVDEDGTPASSTSVDFFGQFQIRNGKLFAAETSRRREIADTNHLATILRYDKGECIADGDQTANPPTPPSNIVPLLPWAPGNMYKAPSVVAVQPGPPTVFQPPFGPQPFGGIVEPHTNRGARMQMTYREDDFNLSHTIAADFNLDVEQLHWAPWADSTVLFDRFDRYTMRLSHSFRRPDLHFFINFPPMLPPRCDYDPASDNSGLSTTFSENLLRGQFGTVVEDQVYTIDPNNAFRSATGTKFIPYPEFEDTYTWRDSRLVSWDMQSGMAVGLGGARDAQSSAQAGGDKTASISSPWINDDFDTAWLGRASPGGVVNDPPWPGIKLDRDQADFLGDRSFDHDPIALPLLVDIAVWPDDTQQVAHAGNLFHIAHIGPLWSPISPGGYYNAAFTSPWLRVWSAGGPDPSSGSNAVTLVEPDKELVARGGVIKDMGIGHPVTGLVKVNAGDSHLHWAQIDLVRKVSLVTSGFWDTKRPNVHNLTSFFQSLDPELDIPENGRPDFSGAADLAAGDLIVVLDPPISKQTGGVRVDVELRGVQTLGVGQDGIYDPKDRESDLFDRRQHIYNPNYACEAYRYDSDNPGFWVSGPRVDVDGLTPYVHEEELGSIRHPVLDTLPRYMNMRVVFENNIRSTPAVSPSLDGMAIVWRMKN